MIRKWQSEDTAPLLSLWLESTTEAHPFIDASYWQANEAVVRDEYRPARLCHLRITGGKSTAGRCDPALGW